MSQSTRGGRLARRMRFEGLEDRRVLSAVTVSTALDVVDGDWIDGIAALIAHPGQDGNISLREAIQAADFDHIDASDTINFASSLAGQQINLSLSAGGELQISDSVVIDASTLSSRLTVSGSMLNPTPPQNGVDPNPGDGSRLLEISSGDVTLNNLILSGAEDVGPSGGGISSQNANLDE